MASGHRDFAPSRGGYAPEAVSAYLKELTDALDLGGPLPRPLEVAERSFPTARRGWNIEEVRQHLATIAVHLATTEATLEPAPDEDPYAATGHEVAAVLNAAHRSAREVVSQAEANAADRRAETEHHVEQRIAELDREIGIREREAADRLAKLHAQTAEAEDAIRQLEARIAEITERAEAELANHRASLDEAREQRARALDEASAAMAEVEHAAQAVLDAAEEEAAHVRLRAEAQANQLLEAARVQASGIVVEAQEHALAVAETAAIEAGQTRRDAETDAERIRVEAEISARNQSNVVLAAAQQRLDELIGRERLVYDQLRAAADAARSAVAEIAEPPVSTTVSEPGVDTPVVAPIAAKASPPRAESLDPIDLTASVTRAIRRLGVSSGTR